MSTEYPPRGHQQTTGSNGENAGLEPVRNLLADSFNFRSPDAPGLHFMGGLADPAMAGFSSALPKISTAGSGLSTEEAETRCLGEAAERLSSLYDTSRAIQHVPSSEVPAELLACVADTTAALPCIQGQRLKDGDAVWVPASLVLHDPTGQLESPAGAVAKGIAAGPDWPAAVNAALEELVERDAAALWWLGGRMPASVSLDLVSVSGAATILAALRQGQETRTTWLLDLTTEFGLTAIAAISVMANGEGFACGLSAKANAAKAAESALIEMAQMELSQHLIRGKAKALGPEGLTEADFKQIERSVRITPQTCPLILPGQPPRPFSGSPDGMISALTKSIDMYVVDCTLPHLDVPVATVLAPALQTLDPAADPPRLSEITRSTGGGAQYHGGIQLI